MADQKKIDALSVLITQKVEQLQTELVRDMYKLSKDIRFESVDQFLFALDQLDIEAIVLQKSANIITLYESAHTQVLADTDMIGEITEETLQTLKSFSTSTFTDSIGKLGGTLKTELVKGIISGTTSREILQAIQAEAGLSPTQMRTLITTGLNDYSRSVTTIMMESRAKAQKYRYVGAIDERTRDICIQIWSLGPMPKQEI